MTFDPGHIIDGKYRVVRHLGAGGMGAVYEGENLRLGRRVAIKVLHQQVACLPEFVERFEREARAAARVGSPHVCNVFDLGDLPSGDRFIVMEYLEGVSLEERLAEGGRLTTHELAPIAFELLEGLGTMHAAGVIHRDLKPANVFLSKNPAGRGEIVKILDFGVAKVSPLAGEVGTMTQTGAMMGTPLYMSPEQARGARDVDARTDVYAASVIFYRALTGELPYVAESLNELLFKIVLEDARPMTEVFPDVDPDFAAIVHNGLSRHLELRIASARDYQSAVAAWGRRQGRTSFAFDVTLASDRPSAQALSAALTASDGGSTSSIKSAAKVDVVPAAASTSMPNSGTPTAWSEDAPEVRTGGGDRKTLASPDAANESAAAPVAEVAATRRGRGLLIGAGGAAALALIGIFALRGRAGDPGTAATPSTTTAVADPVTTPPAPEVKAAMPATILPGPETVADVADAGAAPVAEPASPTTDLGGAKKATGTAAAGKRTDAKPTSAVKSTGEAATPAPTTTPEPVATPATHGRKFRTNLD